MSTANSIEHVAETVANACEMKAEHSAESGGGGDPASVEGIELVEQKTNDDGENGSSSKRLNDIQIEIETRNDNGAEDKIEIVIENSNPKTATVDECETSKANNADDPELVNKVTSHCENSASACQPLQNNDELKRSRTNSVHFGEKPITSNGTGAISEDAEVASTRKCSRLAPVNSTPNAADINRQDTDQLRWSGQKSCCFIFFIILFIIWIAAYWAYMNGYLDNIIGQ